jgi:4-hydroxybenzoate polyprenyltransferase
MSRSFLNKVSDYLSLVKFSHTVFALPFALTGFILAISSTPHPFTLRLLLLVLAAMVTARNAAMGFNRYLDREIDSRNPRTSGRELPSNKLKPLPVLMFVIVNSLLFIAVAAFINKLTFLLSFPALAIVLGYSLMKRFTALCHYVLGLGLAIAPTGAYISITGEFALAPVILSIIVLLWVSGFDIIYALADEEFDSENKLHSVPQLFGKRKALIVSSVGHALVVPLLVLLFFSINNAYVVNAELLSVNNASSLFSVGGFENGLLGWVYIAGAGLFSLLLLWQHMIVTPSNLSRINAAFFTANGYASILFALFVIADLLIL